MCWRIEAGYNDVFAVHSLNNHVVAWKLPFISEVNLDVIQPSGMDAKVSRLREGAEEIGIKYMTQLEATYLNWLNFGTYLVGDYSV